MKLTIIQTLTVVTCILASTVALAGRSSYQGQTSVFTDYKHNSKLLSVGTCHVNPLPLVRPEYGPYSQQYVAQFVVTYFDSVQEKTEIKSWITETARRAWYKTTRIESYIEDNTDYSRNTIQSYSLSSNVFDNRAFAMESCEAVRAKYTGTCSHTTDCLID